MKNFDKSFKIASFIFMLFVLISSASAVLRINNNLNIITGGAGNFTNLTINQVLKVGDTSNAGIVNISGNSSGFYIKASDILLNTVSVCLENGTNCIGNVSGWGTTNTVPYYSSAGVLSSGALYYSTSGIDRFGIGISPASLLHINLSDSTAGQNLIADNYNTGSQFWGFQFRSAGNSTDAIGTIESGKELGRIDWRGMSTVSTIKQVAYITAKAKSNYSTGNNQTAIEIYGTTVNGTAPALFLALNGSTLGSSSSVLCIDASEMIYRGNSTGGCG